MRTGNENNKMNYYLQANNRRIFTFTFLVLW